MKNINIFYDVTGSDLIAVYINIPANNSVRFQI